MRHILVLALVALMGVAPNALAEEASDSDFANYSMSVGFSPFGGSVNFSVNPSRKTSYFTALGGLPAGELEMEIDGTDYTVTSASSWMGFFVQHRPFESAEWFRLVVGLGIGSIENDLEDKDGNKFVADYNENPVGYVGVGFGARNLKGFQAGFDIGWLQTAGPDIAQVEGDSPEAVESISEHVLFGNALPNFQLTLGWGF